MKNMTISKRRFELTKLMERYRQSTKFEKIKILDEFCENFGYDRKYAITLLKAKRLDIKSIGCKLRESLSMKRLGLTQQPLILTDLTMASKFMN